MQKKLTNKDFLNIIKNVDLLFGPYNFVIVAIKKDNEHKCFVVKTILATKDSFEVLREQNCSTFSNMAAESSFSYAKSVLFWGRDKKVIIKYIDHEKVVHPVMSFSPEYFYDLFNPTSNQARYIISAKDLKELKKVYNEKDQNGPILISKELRDKILKILKVNAQDMIKKKISAAIKEEKQNNAVEDEIEKIVNK